MFLRYIILILTITLTCSQLECQTSDKSNKRLRVSRLYIEGNKITKESTILRELTFREGSDIHLSQIDSMISVSTQNLINTSLFHYVTITYDTISIVKSNDNINKESDGGIDNMDIINSSFTINVEERWYWWPLIEMRLEERNMTSWLKKMDMDRITFNTGIKIYNLFGLGHKFEMMGMFGFEQGIGFKYSKMALNKKKTKYLKIEASYTKNKMVDYITKNNKTQHFKSNSVLKETAEVSATITTRNHFRTMHNLTFSFQYSKIADSVFIMNPNYWGTNDNQNRLFGVEYNYTRDYRNYNKYPTEGFYLVLGGKAGESHGFKFAYAGIYADLQRYIKLSDRWFYSTAIKYSSLIKSNSAFILDQGVGYENANLAGYELYVIDGQHYIVSNNSIKYNLLPKKIVKLNFIKNWRRFNKPHFTIYGKVLLDMGYVYQGDRTLSKINGNNYQNKFLLGTGIGIDLITYYDVILSVGYTFNSFGKGNFIFGVKADLF